MSNVTFSGEERLFNELDRKLSENALQSTIDRALINGAKVIERELKSNFAPWSDTGASMNEITISQPFNIDGKRSVVIYWKGSKNRYRIIHINEYGSVHRPNPSGKGSIARAIQSGRNEYFETIKNTIARSL